ncbi:MAG: GDP-mannose 4,6-dehydratase [Anaerolineales bacterium]|nr:GDP-mannose 4,6-dehydratase [Anaerolineales bacterium]MCB9128699.1 GDP-mannose 4,6-dehydratase [Ardenticatenales bacterium]MCB9172609.1 GDP-mannose 4,6-dehydratase [Ardenticatenales bacterium]
MRVLITGVGGFAGSHLAERLSKQPHTELWGTIFRDSEGDGAWATHVTLRTLDLNDVDGVERLLRECQPDHLYHLAATSNVGDSWNTPWPTLANNSRAQLNLLHVIYRLGLNCRILCVSSADIYGAITPDELPVDELTPLRPESPYAVSKVTQDMLAWQYFRSYGVAAIRARPSNHIGPRQTLGFVAPAFAHQIAEIEAGLKAPIIDVGNLTAQRDFTDVRDMVAAYEALLTQGVAGEAYNIGSGSAHAISELLEIMLNAATVPITVRQDPRRMRPSDVPVSYMNIEKLQSATGWQPQIPFEESVLSVLDDWRARVRIDS